MRMPFSRRHRRSYTSGRQFWSQQNKNGKWVSLAFGAGIIIAAIGAAIQFPYSFGSRASYTVVEGEIVSQHTQQVTRYSSYRQPFARDRKVTVCGASVSFPVDGVQHVTTAPEMTDKCNVHNGQKIKVAYDPKDVAGTVTTYVFDNNIHPAALTLMVGGGVLAGGAFVVSALSNQTGSRR